MQSSDKISDYALTADGVSIDCLSSAAFDTCLTPIVMVPGMLGTANSLAKSIELLSPRRVITFSHRGLDKSGSIKFGQGNFHSRCLDIDAVVKTFQLDKYFLYGFSRGVPMVVSHALKNPDPVKGIIIHDCDPIYPRPNPKWKEFILNKKIPYAPNATIEAYCEDADEVNLIPHLSNVAARFLVFKGLKEGSLLSEDSISEISKHLENPEIVRLPHSAHELSEKDTALFQLSMRNFLNP